MRKPTTVPPGRAPFCAKLLVGLGGLLGGTLTSLSAQVEVGGTPLSASRALRPPRTQVLPAPALSFLALEDRLAPKGRPHRFGFEHEVELSLARDGVWEALPDGGRVGRLRVSCPGARSVSFVFSRWQLPRGADLYVYDDAREHVLGGFSWLNNKPNGRMAIRPVPADAVTLEYWEPAGVDAPAELVIERVVHGYRELDALAKSASTASAADCVIDVVCPLGDGFEDVSAATVQVVVGGLLCTGSFLNNTAEDGAQLLMCADHCGDLDDAIFRFGFERSACGNGPAPLDFTVQGSVRLAHDAARDFNLVRVLAPIPPAYGVFLAGWDRRGVAPAATLCVHHPLGLPKAISFDDDPPAKSGVFWNVLAWDDGVTEQGSSGAPLYTRDGRFLGQLCCGQATCGNDFDDSFGALVDAWPDVSAHLDPLGSGASTLDGFDPNPVPTAPPRLTALSVDPLPCLEPGTAQSVRLTGANFAADDQLLFDGRLHTKGSTWIDRETWAFDAPELGSGRHELELRSVRGSATLAFAVEPSDAPRLQVANGDAGDPFFSSFGPVVCSGTGGAVHLLLGSLSPLPSSLPGRVELALGYAFTQLHTLAVIGIGPDGLGRFELLLPGGPGLRGRTIWLQTIEVARPLRFPLPTSNRQAPVFQF